jgi:hypothetical protein
LKNIISIVELGEIQVLCKQYKFFKVSFSKSRADENKKCPKVYLQLPESFCQLLKLSRQNFAVFTANGRQERLVDWGYRFGVGPIPFNL